MCRTAHTRFRFTSASTKYPRVHKYSIETRGFFLEVAFLLLKDECLWAWLPRGIDLHRRVVGKS